ncbi:MAG: FAD-dependent oxidoreductase [Patescibacteria group bacterium]
MYLSKLLVKKESAKKTTTFFFEKPKKFKFIPGQFIEITLNKEVHSFSIASSPEEKEVMIATRMRPTKFKKFLGKLKIGAKIKIEGPFGQFVLHKNMGSVFLAGGIGITPFRSMIKSFPNREITLFYSNRKPKEAVFLNELINLGKQNKKFKLIATMTKATKKEWNGHFGYISQKMIKNNLKNWRSVIYYVVGSSGFVQAMADILSKMGLKPEQIKTENFPGY